MTIEEILSEFRDFYHHDYDGDGMPFIAPVNPVHTIFQFKGSKEAVAAVVALATDTMLSDSTSEREYEKLEFYPVGQHFVIDIRTNNFIPQLYDALKATDGVSELNYTVYDAANRRMITDRESMAKAIKHAQKLDVDIEVDDEPDMFPDEYEFSLPDLNDAD